MKKKVAIYCRIDRGGDPEMRQFCAEGQAKQLASFAEEQGYIVVKQYFDIGFTGHDLTGPEWTHLLHDAKAGLFEAILVTKHDRLYRGSVWNFPPMPVPIITANYPLAGLRRKGFER